MLKFWRTILLSFGLLFLSACASVQTPNPRDPYESFNRASYSFNDKLDRAVLKPAAEAYRFVTPQPVRTGVSNVFGNVRDVWSFANHLMQFRAEAALTDFFRVTMNTVFGLGGLIDVASSMGLKKQHAGFGDTLAHYGWKESHYLVLPVFGSSTVRDGLGTGVDLLASPLNHSLEPAARNVATGLNVIQTRESLLGMEDIVSEAALDPYALTRDAYLQMRAKQIGTFQAEDESLDWLDESDVAPSSSE